MHASQVAQTTILIVGVSATLFINPWFGYDPINLPKMLVLCTGSGFLVGWFIMDRPKFYAQFGPMVIATLLLATSFLVSFFSNNAPWYQQLWGTWGRSTGLVTYISFLIIMLASMFFVKDGSMAKLRMIFERLGYFITGYAFLQLLELDPINWSQKAIVVTLGNINFMSSFLGLASISYASHFLRYKLNLITKSFYLFLTLTNLSIIILSKSIQGLGIFLAGLTLLITFKIKAILGYLKAITFLLTTIATGLFALLGTGGFGPLSSFRQDTVLFRLDYWTAGINMLIANPLNGVGLDSYGDYYREFRSLEAVTRTGPQRVTNTAHNIFIDVSVNAGFFAGFLFIAIFFLTGVSILKSLRRENPNVDLQAISAMWFGFVVFCLISINQIGVGVWGFIFMGAINGFVVKDRVNSLDLVPTSNPPSTKLSASKKRETGIGPDFNFLAFKKWHKLILSIFFAGIMFSVTLIPNLADARFLETVKSRDLNEALIVVEDFGVQDFHVENLIMDLEREGRSKEALSLALALSKRNPQNWDSWVQIVASPVATAEQKSLAAKNLLRLDPNNALVKEELRKAFSSQE